MRLFHLLILTFAGAFALAFSSCQKAPQVTITTPVTIELSVDGGSGSITFTANRDWSIRCSDSWVSVSPSSGQASKEAITVKVSCYANMTYEDREAIVTITAEDAIQTTTIKQPANLGVLIPFQSYNLASSARTFDVEVSANVLYTVKITGDWIKQTGTKGLTTNILTFSAEENQTYDAREGTITIKPQESSGVANIVISVHQAQKDAMIVEKKSFDMPYGGGEVEVKVEANVSFDVKPDVDWIHFVETKALSGSTVRLKVDENPTYSAREGKIEIKQKNGSLSHTITVKQAGRIAVTSIELNKTSLTLKEGESETLSATVKPDNATDKTVTWTSSNAGVASVDAAGNVSAIKEGTAIITAQAGEKTAKCEISVYKDIPVSSIELDKSTLSLVVGDETTLKATVKPDDTTFKTVSWTSSNASIATVNENGKVVAVAKGNATITAKAGDKETGCKVFIKAAKYKTPSDAVDLGLSVDWAKSDFNMPYLWDLSGYFLWGDPTGNAVVMDYVAPELNNICDTQYDMARVRLGKGWRLPTREEVEELLSSCVWQESTTGAWLYGPNGQGILLRHTGIALPSDGPAGSVSLTFKDKGYVMTGESTGSGESRMAFAYQFDKNFSYNLVSYNAAMVKFPIRPVFESLDGTIPVSSISLNKTELTLQVGDSETLTATVKPDDATDKTVTWSSSNNAVAIVDSNGKMVALKEGSSTITAAVGNLSTSCSVTVYPSTLPSTITMNTGEVLGVKPTEVEVQCSFSSDVEIIGVAWSTAICLGLDSEPSIDDLSVKFGTTLGNLTAKFTNLSPGQTYYYRPAFYYGGRYYYGNVRTVTTSDLAMSSFVDLGLSVKWAACNLGATSPDEPGDYFAWGETKTKEKTEFTQYNYLYYDSIGDVYINLGNDIAGTQYDAATKTLGNGYRMPTREETAELRNKCKWTEPVFKGKKGYIVEGPSGNSIFILTVSCTETSSSKLMYSQFWTSTLCPKKNYQPNDAAYYLNYSYFNTENNFRAQAVERHVGLPIRPVTE